MVLRLGRKLVQTPATRQVDFDKVVTEVQKLNVVAEEDHKKQVAVTPGVEILLWKITSSSLSNHLGPDSQQTRLVGVRAARVSDLVPGRYRSQQRAFQVPGHSGMDCSCLCVAHALGACDRVVSCRCDALVHDPIAQVLQLAR